MRNEKKKQNALNVQRFLISFVTVRER